MTNNPSAVADATSPKKWQRPVPDIRVRRPQPVPDIETLPGAALLTGAQVCALSGYSPQALKKWRKSDRGPRVTFVEGQARYRADDVRHWLAGGPSTKRPESAPA
jgi:hypothetical protein